uniref:Uncharacterized protein n=1 Tax=Aplanochytrium stocchinoi TaxID=215587 RepID=A0A6S7ZPW3_9STRA|mmetsp:Transcript_1323/g.1698  ORF Transcript_1323/g.1698 Transcript_1323/m.1698 type:complete len:143 (-) Transcript_1323:151-579(-)
MKMNNLRIFLYTQLEIAGYKEDALRVRDMLGPQLSNGKKKHISKHDKKVRRRTSSLYKNPSLGQIMVHPEDNGHPRQLERLPSLDMLWSRSPTASKLLYKYHWPQSNRKSRQETELIVHPTCSNPTMREALPTVNMKLARKY